MSKMDIVREAWGIAAPDWIVALARACDATSQNKTAERVGYSASTVSSVLKGTYGGDMRTVEDHVRGVFLSETVRCPVLGALPKNKCATWRKRARSPELINTLRTTMRRACLECPRNREDK